MNTALVGNTGFVGSNLAAKHPFEHLYHSANIQEAYGTNPDLLIYAGVRAEKFLANQNPEQDFLQIQGAFDNICKIAPQKLVLISTIDVYYFPVEVDENTIPDRKKLQAYGANRLWLEQQVKKQFPDCLIVRLPGLFGENLKKNFIFDFIHRIPNMLSQRKMNELLEKDQSLLKYYELQKNGFYKCYLQNEEDWLILKEVFARVNFSALNFTDSRGVYQFYNLEFLWEHIKIALENDLKLLNIATEPVSAGEVYEFLTGENFKNYISDNPPYYNFKTVHAELYGGKVGYLVDKQTILYQIKEFVLEHIDHGE